MAGPSADPEALLGAAADFTGALLGSGKFAALPSWAQNLGPALAAVAPIYSALVLAKEGTDVETIPNLHFIQNGHAEGDGSDASPVTKAYLLHRKYKSLAAGAWGVAGAASSLFASGVDGFSAARHVNAGASTGIHIYRLQQIAKRYRQSQTIANWCDVVQRMKWAKAGVRGAQLVGAVTPVPLAQTVLGATAAGLGAITSTFSGACMACAAEIHWRAFQESALAGRTGGGIGPATQIMNELFRRRTATRVLGAYDVAALIREPAGWMAVGDKIVLI